MEMRNTSSESRDMAAKELEKIFVKYYDFFYNENYAWWKYFSSFMITDHPHNGVNPVLIYQRKGPGIYIAKVSVFIVSLLHDFMQKNPNLIELYDIGE